MGKRDKAQADLVAAGLPNWLKGAGVKNPCPVLVNGVACGLPSTKYNADAQFKYFRCSATPPHEWKRAK